MPRHAPPRTNERPTNAALSRPPSRPVPPLPATRRGDVVGMYVFVALIALGLLAAARAFLSLGA